MAEISDAELESFSEALLKVAKTYNILDKSLLALDTTVKKGDRTWMDEMKVIQVRNRLQKGVSQELESYIRAAKEGNASWNETTAALREMREQALKAAGDDEALREVIKKDFEQKENLIKLQQVYYQTLGKVVPVLAGTVGGLVNVYQRSATGLEAALSGASVGLALFTAGIKATAGLFAGVPVVGQAINAAATGISESVEKIKPKLDEEVKKLAGSFKDAANAGLVFADGVTGLKNAAGEAGLTTGIFTDAIKQNAEAVSIFGGNVTAGARAIGRVSKLIDVESFQKLGYTLDEIPGLIAQVGARLRRSGITGDAQVAQATADYAKNLRLIADLTGQDAKTAMEKQDAAEKDLAYQQFLAEKTPAEAQAIRTQMSLLPESVQAMAKEMMISGGQLTSDVTNITAQQIPAYKAMADAAYNAAVTGTAGSDTALKILQANSAAAELQTRSITDFARASSILGGDLQPIAEGIANDRKMLLRVLSAGSLEELKTNIEVAAKTKDPTTEKLAQAERDGMKIMAETQQAVITALDDYLKIVNNLNKITLLAVQGFTKLVEVAMGPEKEKFSSNQRQLAEAAALGNRLSTERRGFLGMFGSEAEAAKSSLASMKTDEIQKLADLYNTTIENLYAAAGTNAEEIKKIQDKNAQQAQAMGGGVLGGFGKGQAYGGIVSGPDSGYLAKLHGTEAVLPENLTEMLLDAAKTNSMNSNQVDDKIASVISQFGSTGIGGGNTESLLETLVRKMDDLITSTNNVGNYTELTAQRIA